jgi:hypothetical protein
MYSDGKDKSEQLWHFDADLLSRFRPIAATNKKPTHRAKRVVGWERQLSKAEYTVA